MGFYQKLSDYYDIIFPFRKEKYLSLIKAVGENTEYVLDIGCATGNFTLYITALGVNVTGIDPSDQMIRIALKKSSGLKPPPCFLTGGMNDLSDMFSTGSFDKIYCLGNTIPHLKKREDIYDFFYKVRSVLKKDGVFAAQLLNYKKIIEKGKIFPVINRPGVKFYRNYELDKKSETASFKMRLVIEEEGKELEDSVILTPFESEIISDAALSAGFTKIDLYGGLDLCEFEADSSEDLIFIIK